eukprot:1202149-Rhodomonas_salina.1
MEAREVAREGGMMEAREGGRGGKHQREGGRKRGREEGGGSLSAVCGATGRDRLCQGRKHADRLCHRGARLLLPISRRAPCTRCVVLMPHWSNAGSCVLETSWRVSCSRV